MLIVLLGFIALMLLGAVTPMIIVLLGFVALMLLGLLDFIALVFLVLGCLAPLYSLQGGVGRHRVYVPPFLQRPPCILSVLHC